VSRRAKREQELRDDLIAALEAEVVHLERSLDAHTNRLNKLEAQSSVVWFRLEKAAKPKPRKRVTKVVR
jgi:hypothetical protein